MSQEKEIKYEEKIPHGNDIKSTEGDVTDRMKAGPFLWGAATSSYQVEGGVTNNDWDFFTRSEKVRDRIVKLTSVAAAASNSDKDNKKKIKVMSRVVLLKRLLSKIINHQVINRNGN
ncbi:MAG: hypothetical protein WBV84_06600 [Nitrososphaeraceae archaeon]